MRTSTKAWAALGGAVVVYDVFAPEGETLSEGFDSWLEGPGKTFAAVSTVLVAMHLLNLLDAKYDPVSWMFVGMKVLKR